MKRAFDIVASGVGLILLLPLLTAIGLMILLFDGRPVLFRQQRIGFRQQPFWMLKFRTMVRDAERLGKPLTTGGDPRITPLGNWLRKFKLDELPQLYNVFVGEMSLVGPRPEVARYVAYYTPAERRVLELKPGITDPASVRYHNESEMLEGLENPEKTYIEKHVPEKIRLNLEYAERANLWRDFGVIFQTVMRICWR